MLSNLLDAYFRNPPQDGVHGQSTGQIMALGPGIASLVFWTLKSLHCARFLGPKIACYWGLLYKKLPMGAVVDMALYGIDSRPLLHNLGYLNGVALQPSPVLGPKQGRAAGQPIQIPLVMDTVA